MYLFESQFIGNDNHEANPDSLDRDRYLRRKLRTLHGVFSFHPHFRNMILEEDVSANPFAPANDGSLLQNS